MKTILDLHNIYYSYHTSHGETRALSNLSFSLAPGEFAAVVGHPAAANLLCSH